MPYDFSNLKKEGEKAKEWLVQETMSMRTNRATPALVENIMVDSYGAKTPLKHVAAISADDARTLRISPWDSSILKNIEKAISDAQIGIQPIADKNTIRMNLPELTQERRQALIKLLSQKLEEIKISLRRSRDEVWKDIQAKEKEGKMSEDEKFRNKNEMEKIIDETTKSLEDTAKKKEAEILA